MTEEDLSYQANFNSQLLLHWNELAILFGMAFAGPVLTFVAQMLFPVTDISLMTYLLWPLVALAIFVLFTLPKMRNRAAEMTASEYDLSDLNFDWPRH